MSQSDEHQTGPSDHHSCVASLFQCQRI